MDSDHGDILRRVFSEIAENMAFMFVEEPDDETPAEPENDDLVLAHMVFSGPFSGRLVIAVPAALCPEIAANVLGLDPDDELVKAKPYDALKELLNVTCGNVLPAIAGEDPVFDLTPPEIKKLDRAAWRVLRDMPGTQQHLVEDEPVLLQMSVEK